MKSFGCLQFIENTWEQFLAESLRTQAVYDVVLCASSLHYAENQENMIHSLMQLCAPEGLLILEVGIAPGRDARWVEVKRSIDSRLFPTRAQLEEILRPYAWKDMGQSVSQTGDPLPRQVFHVRRKKPCIFLLMQESGSGKSTVHRQFIRNCHVVSGDVLIANIAAGRVPDAELLHARIAEGFSPSRIDKAVTRICESGLLRLYCELVRRTAAGRDAVYDGYIPRAYRSIVEQHFAETGYIPLRIESAAAPSLKTSGTHVFQEARKYMLFLAAAMKRFRARP